ncbi:hypothetical protein MTO96_040459 [Rhipicephalus appendiculatus]
MVSPEEQGARAPQPTRASCMDFTASLESASRQRCSVWASLGTFPRFLFSARGKCGKDQPAQQFNSELVEASFAKSAMAKGQKHARRKVSTCAQGRPAASGVDSLAASTQDEKQPAMAKAKTRTRQQASTSVHSSPGTSGLERRVKVTPRIKRFLYYFIAGIQLRPQQKQEPLKKSAALTKTLQERAAWEGRDVLPHRLHTKSE